MKLSNGWEWAGIGEWPTDPPESGELGEDVFAVSRVNVLLDVGWYPECDPTGFFRCKRIVDEDWEHPTETLITRDPETVSRWLSGHVERQ